MPVLKKYNGGTSAWEAVAVGASGANGLNGYSYTSVTTYTTTSVTLGNGDIRGLILLSNASAITATIPADYGTTGDTVTILQYGAGQVTVAGAGGVTLRNSTTLKTRSQYSAITLIRLATNEWLIAGDTAAA
jgi:hypothetical protein